MAAVPSREVTTSQINSVGFSFYSDEEIRKLSVKKIFSPLALDNLKHPIPNGYYDPALGPLDMFDTCATCGLRYRACPGHFGHIELAVPVYNPLVFPTLFKLLRSTCRHCFKFKMAEEEVEKFASRLALLDEGHLVEACKIKLSSSGAVTRTYNKMMGEDYGAQDELKIQAGPSISVTEEKGFMPSPKQRRTLQTCHTLEAVRECSLEFFKRIPSGACQNCGAHNATLKKEGTKIFEKPLDPKRVTANQMRGINMDPILASRTPKEGGDLQAQVAERLVQQADGTQSEEKEGFDKFEKDDKKSAKKDDEKDEGEEPTGLGAVGTTPNKRTNCNTALSAIALLGVQNESINESYKLLPSQRFVTPAEVRETLRRLWSNQTRLLSYLFGRIAPSEGCGSKRVSGPKELREGATNGYKAFFLQTIAVPPNNVRPVARMGDMTIEHPQNAALTMILNHNLDLVSMNEMSKAANPDGTGLVGGFNMAEALKLWLSLQNAVSLLIDSNAADGQPTTVGIKQLLEKKEGLFRKNMMGKRVNFAARSVISPDPYLGSGEIGVPPYFAVRLSVPERVTPLNVQELREMVIRGANEHPGANAVEDENGRVISLGTMPRFVRTRLAVELEERAFPV